MNINFLIFLIALFLPPLNNLYAQSYDYRSPGIGLAIDISQKNDSMQVSCTLTNYSMDTIYYSPKCVIFNNPDLSVVLELGCIYYSFDVSLSPVILKALAASKSANFTSRSKIDELYKTVFVSFDCLRLEKLSKNYRRKLKKKLEPYHNIHQVYCTDYIFYNKICTDRFQMELPRIDTLH